MDGIYEMECPMFDTVVAAESARFDWEIVTWLPGPPRFFRRFDNGKGNTWA